MTTEHGTVAGYSQHKRNHTRSCRPCRAAWTLYCAEWRADHPTPLPEPRHGGMRCAVCNRPLRDHEIGGRCYREYLLSRPRRWRGRFA